MKRLSAITVVLLLTACSQKVTQEGYVQAVELCQSRGGFDYARIRYFRPDIQWEVSCKNGSNLSYGVKP